MSGSFENLAAALTARAARLAAAHGEARRGERRAKLRESTGWRSAARLWPLFARGD